jgi:REP element-mobilizing transposase RayT
MSSFDDRFRRRKHRLPLERYAGKRTVAYTILVEDRKPLFQKQDVIDRLLDLLALKMGTYKCDVPIYCFMPDHLHVLARGLDDDANSKIAMDRFKLSVGIWLGTNYPAYSLHHDYFDHIVRCSEDWGNQARYIALNPVRRGLVEHAIEFALRVASD